MVFLFKEAYYSFEEIKEPNLTHFVKCKILLALESLLLYATLTQYKSLHIPVPPCSQNELQMRIVGTSSFS